MKPFHLYFPTFFFLFLFLVITSINNKTFLFFHFLYHIQFLFFCIFLLFPVFMKPFHLYFPTFFFLYLVLVITRINNKTFLYHHFVKQDQFLVLYIFLYHLPINNQVSFLFLV